MTTFARIAKILKGQIEPRNWVEEAFGDISGGGGSPLIVTLTSNEQGGYDSDYTVEEIYSHFANGETVQLRHAAHFPTSEPPYWGYTYANVQYVMNAALDSDPTNIIIIQINAGTIDYLNGTGWTVHS